MPNPGDYGSLAIESRTTPRQRSVRQVQPLPPRKRSRNDISDCPHSLAIVRTRRGSVEKECSICREPYGTTPAGGDIIVPVKLPCQHVFCQSCVEIHYCDKISCPLPYCTKEFPIQPETCSLCAYWAKENGVPLLVTVRAAEMVTSIRKALKDLATETKLYSLSRPEMDRLMRHVKDTLTEHEWRYYSGNDLAEILDPFLLAVDQDAAYKYYGAKLVRPAPRGNAFPARTNDPDDYPAGREPWVAAFFRQWALEYERDNGEVKEGLGVPQKLHQRNPSGGNWPYKRILAHKTEANGTVMYLVKWVGKRFLDEWVGKNQLCQEDRMKYDIDHEVQHPGVNSQVVIKKRRTL
ncbi:hypothetical protein BDV96DRAFT_604949 [Lophiotrema nucula]|uniref:RING-type domain-containing protein n=1 Tax=Lophiotrema nucula TaxID=690887 RepID=A0A6A5YRZ7_9PLEO|nr:hypothetical protein BDV96DRAFT_604949 [Lophiotrema nucula]